MFRLTLALLIAACIDLLQPTSACGAKPVNPGLIELRLKQRTIEGRVLHKSEQKAWLYDRSGRLEEVPLQQVTSFKQISETFSSVTPLKVATDLQKEFGHEFETATSRHYVVVAPKGRAKQYVQIFDEVYRNFRMYFSVRGFTLNELEFPLIGVVLPDRAAFVKYAEAEGIRLSSGVAGYYLSSSNRVAVFEGPVYPQARLDDSPERSFLSPNGTRMSDLFGQARAKTTTTRDLEATVVHEATHQIAFNVGLHDRIGRNPKWVIEGLATAFEAPGIRNGTHGKELKHRLNHERFVWFKNYIKERRPKAALETFLANDELFDTAALDAYAEAWALSFYLIETRPRQYADYLKRVSDREGETNALSKRVAEFQKVFGTNFKMFEPEYLRFYERLK